MPTHLSTKYSVKCNFSELFYPALFAALQFLQAIFKIFNLFNIFL